MYRAADSMQQCCTHEPIYEWTNNVHFFNDLNCYSAAKEEIISQEDNYFNHSTAI